MTTETVTDITIRRSIKWNSSALTDVGTIRSVNEDAILTNPKCGLWIVADGMGGYDAGDVASNMVIKSLEEIDYSESIDESIKLIETSLININQKILDYSETVLDKKMMGSTVVSLLIRGRLGACLWAGDSRLYRFRNGELTQLTRDHSHVEELVQQGLLKKEDAQNHPNSNVITRAIGANEDINIDATVFEILISDTFLLCSDGLYNSISLNDMTECLKISDVSNCTKNMLAKALDNKASDNVSVIIIKGEVERLNGNIVDSSTTSLSEQGS